MTTQITSSAPFASIDTHYWTWQGHRVAYAVQGKGVPLVLIHGFGASIGHWRRNIPALADAGYRVFAIDLLGFGKSEKPLLDYCMELWEEMLTEFWQAQIGEPTVFVGNSIGALLALIMLANHPEMSRGGVLLNAAGGLNHRPEELNLPLRTIMAGFTKLVSSALVGPFLFNIIRQKPRLRKTLHQVYQDHTAVTDELIDLIYEPACDPGAQKVFAKILTAPPGPKPEELLPRVTQPLLILWGEADPWTPISGATLYQNLANQSDQVEFTPIPNTGHCPHDERPDLVNAEMIQWLSRRVMQLI